MSNIFRRPYTQPLPTTAELISVKGVPSARFKRKGKTVTAPLTKDGNRVLIPSPWYGRVNDAVVRLFTDAIASQQKLAELIRNAELDQTDIADPFREQRKRPLVEHVADWQAAMRNDGAGAKHVAQFVSCVRRIIRDCRFVFMNDISASRVQQHLADMRKDRNAVITVDPAKKAYTRRELASLLNIEPCAVTSFVARHRLAASGEGKGTTVSACDG